MELNPLEIIREATMAMLRDFLASLPQLTIAIIVLVLTPLIGRTARAVVAGVMGRTKTRQALVTLATNLAGLMARGAIVGIAADPGC